MIQTLANDSAHRKATEPIYSLIVNVILPDVLYPFTSVIPDSRRLRLMFH